MKESRSQGDKLPPLSYGPLTAELFRTTRLVHSIKSRVNTSTMKVWVIEGADRTHRERHTSSTSNHQCMLRGDHRSSAIFDQDTGVRDTGSQLRGRQDRLLAVQAFPLRLEKKAEMCLKFQGGSFLISAKYARLSVSRGPSVMNGTSVKKKTIHQLLRFWS